MNAITKTDPKAPLAAGNGVSAIVPNTVEATYRLGQMVIAGGWAPKDMRSAETVAIAIMQGMEIGLKPMQALQSIAVINGRPSIFGDAAIGLVQSSGVCEYIKEWSDGEGDQMVAFCEAKRLNSPSVVTQRFSVEDAKLAGLWGKAGPWKQYPRRMLQMRARSFALRDAFADVLKGLSVAEEMQDVPIMRDVTPRERPQRDLAAELDEQTSPDHDTATGEVTEKDDELAPNMDGWAKQFSVGIKGCATIDEFVHFRLQHGDQIEAFRRHYPDRAAKMEAMLAGIEEQLGQDIMDDQEAVEE